MYKKLILLTITIVVLLSCVIFFFVTRKAHTQTATATPVPLPKEVIVTLTDKGFEPSSTTIQAGSAVRFINNSSSSKASVNSDDYPDNKKFPELNLGIFQKGSTLAHIFKKVQTYTYHDQFNPEHRGTIIVQ